MTEYTKIKLGEREGSTNISLPTAPVILNYRLASSLIKLLALPIYNSFALSAFSPRFIIQVCPDNSYEIRSGRKHCRRFYNGSAMRKSNPQPKMRENRRRGYDGRQEA